MKRTNGFNRVETMLLILVTGILGMLSLSVFKATQMQSMQAEGVNNCQQIITALKQFAKDHQGHYTDEFTDSKGDYILHYTTNDAFRELIRSGIVTDEKIFGCPTGYNPDGIIGSSPKFEKALGAAENHWSMTARQTEASNGSMPLVFENSLTNSWPPLWDVDTHVRRNGRTWPGGQIIIGCVDGSVAVETLVQTRGLMGPKILSDGLDTFIKASSGIPCTILRPILIPEPPYTEPPAPWPYDGAKPGQIGRQTPSGLPY